MTYNHQEMAAAEIDAFLAVTRHALLATNRVDGPPQVSPVWYLYRDGRIYIDVGPDSAKCRNLRRDPHLSLCVDGTFPDARYVVIYGTVSFLGKASPDYGDIVRAIAERYHDSREAAAQYLRDVAGVDSVLLVVSPYKIFGLNYN